MNIKQVAVYGRKHHEEFTAWLMENGARITCYIDDTHFGFDYDGIPVVNLPTFLSEYQSSVDAVLVNHMWNLFNSKSYFSKLIEIKKPVLWNSISLADFDERTFEYSKRLIDKHFSHCLDDFGRSLNFIGKFQVGWDTFSEMLTASYDLCEPHTLSILEDAYKCCTIANSDPVDMVRQYAAIYSRILTKKRMLPSSDEYCYEKVSPKNGDMVISAGGDLGHEIPEFLGKTGLSGRVIIFEPSKSSVDYLNSRFQGDERISISNKALHCRSGEIEFFESADDPGVSTLLSQRQTSNCSRYTVQTVSLDDYVDQNSLSRIDFIKMDIEGAEYEALIGAEKTIKRFTPMLSICVYHFNPNSSSILDEDILRIPALIRSFVPGYRLLLVNTEPTPWGGMKMFGIHEEHTR